MLVDVCTGVDEQGVLDSGCVEVVRTLELGHSVAVDAHLVTMISSVVQTVEVVIWCQEWLVVGTSGTDEVQWKGGKEAVDFGGSEGTVCTGVDGQTVVDSGYVDVIKTVE